MSQPAADPGFGVFVTDQPATGNAVGALPDPGLGDVIGAHWTIGRQETAGAPEQAVTDAYGPVVNALLSANGSPTSRYVAVGPANPVNTGAIWSDVAAARKANPGFLHDIPASSDAEFQAWVHKQEAERRARAQQVVSRQSGAAQAVAGFGTDIAAGFTDPINLGAMMLTGGSGGAGKTVVQVMAREALTNAGIEAAQLPNRAAVRSSYGEDMSATDMAKDVAFAGIGGAAFGGALHLGGHAIGAAADAGYVPGFSPEQRTARAIAGAPVPPVSDAEVLDHFNRTVPPDQWTPDMAAAVHVLTRQHEVDQSNPFVPNPAGMDAHVQRLDAAIANVDRALRLDDVPPAAAGVTPPASGFSGVRAVAQRIIGHEDASGSPTARNPRSTATGLGQFTEGTWLRFADANPDLVPKSLTRAQKLAMRTDPLVSTAMTERAVGSYVDTLRAHGAPVTDGNVYLVHFLGEKGALDVLHADPETPVSALLGADAVPKNPEWLKGKTAGQLVADMDRRMGGSGQPAMGAPTLDRAGFDSDEEWRTAQAALDVQHEREALAAPEDVLDVPSYVDRYLAGEGRDDPEMQQFAANNAPAIEEEFQRRAAQPEAPQPMAQDRPPSISVDIGEEGEPVSAPRRRAAAPTRDNPRIRSEPADVLTFLADHGGLRDDEEHDLRGRGKLISGAISGKRRRGGSAGMHLPQFAPGGGHLFRKSGMSIDAAGELLHEAGYFGHGGERPSTDEVLELLDRANRKPTFRPDDQAEMEARAADRDYLDQATSEVDQAIRDGGYDLDLTDAEKVRLFGERGEDRSLDDALFDLMRGRGAATEEQIASLLPEDYDSHAFDDDGLEIRDTRDEGPDGEPAAGNDGPAASGAAEDGGGAQPQEPAGAAGEGGARLDDAQAAGDTGPLPDDPETIAETAAVFDDEAGPAAIAQSDSIEHDLAMAAEKAKPPKAKRKRGDENPHVRIGQRFRATERIDYLSAGETYEVEHGSKREAYFRNVGREGRTSVESWQIKRALDNGTLQPVEIEAPEPPPLDRGAETDPAVAERQRQQAELGAKSPLRARAEQDGTMGLGLFDAADQPGFRLTEDGDPVSFDEAMKAADSDLDAVEKARACMTPPGGGDGA